MCSTLINMYGITSEPTPHLRCAPMMAVCMLRVIHAISPARSDTSASWFMTSLCSRWRSKTKPKDNRKGQHNETVRTTMIY